jgi:ABC-type lipoprotein release transport system permease subunit
MLLGAPGSDRPWVTVVGIVADAPGRGGAAPHSLVAVPFAQWPGRPVEVHVRARGDGRALVPAVRRAAAEAVPDEPVEGAQTARDAARERFRPVRLIAQALSALAAFAMALAALGVYGVVAYAAARRTREIGVRVALGATRRDVLRLFGSQGARLAAAGAALGLAGAAATTRALGAMLFGTDPLDPTVLAGGTALLAAVAVTASWIPARRAARLDPVVALRTE